MSSWSTPVDRVCDDPWATPTATPAAHLWCSSHSTPRRHRCASPQRRSTPTAPRRPLVRYARPMAPHENSTTDVSVNDAPDTGAEQIVEDELELIEEISIDGMCGVY